MLLACHDAAGDFLESSPGYGVGVVDDLDLERVPEKIGRFRIERVLGAGGMGCVYLAESSEPRVSRASSTAWARELASAR